MSYYWYFFLSREPAHVEVNFKNTSSKHEISINFSEKQKKKKSIFKFVKNVSKLSLKC